MQAIVSGVETVSHVGHCLVNLTVYKVYGEQDKGGENMLKCLAVGFTITTLLAIVIIPMCT